MGGGPCGGPREVLGSQTDNHINYTHTAMWPTHSNNLTHITQMQNKLFAVCTSSAFLFCLLGKAALDSALALNLFRFIYVARKNVSYFRVAV